MINMTPIGIIHTPFKKREGMPIQPVGAAGTLGTVEIFEEFQAGLADLDGFSHIYLLYHFHQSHEYKMKVVPFMDSVARGLFATRAPKRPNPIGLSVVQLDRVTHGTLFIQNIDVLDGTPLLDIKPFVPYFDSPTTIPIRTGWLEKTQETAKSRKSDKRFIT